MRILALASPLTVACGPDVVDPPAATASAGSSGDTPPSCVPGAVRGPAGWSRSLGASGSFSTSWSAASVAAAPDGSFAVATIVTGPLQLDCVEYPAIGDSDLLVARFEADGSLRFARRYGAAGASVSAAYAGVAETGEQFLVATARGGVPIQLGDRSVPAGLFLASLDATGELRFATGSSVDGELTVVDVAFTPTGLAMVGGNLDGRIDFGSWSVGDAPHGESRVLIASWDHDGTLFGAGFRDQPQPLTSMLLEGDIFAMSGPDDTLQGEVLVFDAVDQPLSSRSPALGPMQLGPENWIVGGYFGDPPANQLLVAVDPATGADRWQVELVSWSGVDDGDSAPSTQRIVVGDAWIHAAVSLTGKADFGLGELATDAPFESVLLTLSPDGALQAQRRLRSNVRDLAISPEGRLALTTVDMHPWADADLGKAPTACQGCDQTFLATIDP